MRQCSYRNFSLSRAKNQKAAGNSVCHFELTYRCNLSCEHCQTACFSTPSGFRRELSTEQVLAVLDKMRAAGVLWVTFSGGDPFCRPDFSVIYAYAKRCGFLITIMSNALGITPEMLRLLSEQPPFRVEVTLNALSPALHARISGVNGSLPQIRKNLRLLRRKKIPLLLKAQVTRSNSKELPALKKFASRLRVPLDASALLNARLDGDTAPCRLRLEPGEYAAFYGGSIDKHSPATRAASPFFCGVFSGHGISVDAYGDVFLCDMIRNPGNSILKYGVARAADRARAALRPIRFNAKSKCRSCAGFGNCGWCPGQAYLEVSSPSKELPYYCRVWQEAVR
ncbi:MAG: radical SAM protein [Elusimicrobia bacterium]|nr:radical SAM protein [Elusimicrobiota bacterium]